MRRILIAAVVVSLTVSGGALAQTVYQPPKPYTYSPPKPPQAPYQNYGSISSTTGRPMTNTVSGYVRRDGTYVNPYARSGR